MADFEILLSCMNLKDDIIMRSNICSDTIIINQCGQEKSLHYKHGDKTIRIFSVKERGLTKSRNMAIRMSEGDICLLCDDDEYFYENYEKEIIHAYHELDNADLIAFKTANIPEKFKGKIKKLNRFDIMKISSWQISFKRKKIIDSGVWFDENMGAGTGNGAEEEFKFLSDCLDAGLKIYYYPLEIADVKQTESTWFKGYNKEFFVNRGVTTRYIMGMVPAFFYGMYYVLFKRKQFKNEISAAKAFLYICTGIKENRLKKGKTKNE
ncbi:glycosyltransferase [Porcipelethomonas sp.]|uniref:glycosyltransferase family A protein n=1 Tax=Porcipelethomonas sp. TaxID=2981675 RepID=UPI003EF245EF